MDFESIWARYPNRKGKKEAARHFNASVKTEADMDDIEAALENYKDEIERNGTALKYVQNGKTWFNNWRDYIPGKPDTQQTIGNGVHRCMWCDEPHDWICSQCDTNDDYACPEYRKKIGRK